MINIQELMDWLQYWLKKIVSGIVQLLNLKDEIESDLAEVTTEE